jgi:Family of unknown function (DUF5681)
MAFTKGKSGNPHGREKGSQNKATAAVKERIEQVLNDLDTTLTADLKALKPEQRVELWAKLASIKSLVQNLSESFPNLAPTC